MIKFEKVYLQDVPTALHRFISRTLSNWGGNPHVGYEVLKYGIIYGYIFKSNLGTKEDKVFAHPYKYIVVDMRNLNSIGTSSLKKAKEIAKKLLL